MTTEPTAQCRELDRKDDSRRSFKEKESAKEKKKKWLFRDDHRTGSESKSAASDKSLDKHSAETQCTSLSCDSAGAGMSRGQGNKGDKEKNKRHDKKKKSDGSDGISGKIQVVKDFLSPALGGLFKKFKTPSSQRSKNEEETSQGQKDPIEDKRGDHDETTVGVTEEVTEPELTATSSADTTHVVKQQRMLNRNMNTEVMEDVGLNNTNSCHSCQEDHSQILTVNSRVELLKQLFDRKPFNMDEAPSPLELFNASKLESQTKVTDLYLRSLREDAEITDTSQSQEDYVPHKLAASRLALFGSSSQTRTESVSETSLTKTSSISISTSTETSRTVESHNIVRSERSFRHTVSNSFQSFSSNQHSEEHIYDNAVDLRTIAAYRDSVASDEENPQSLDDGSLQFVPGKSETGYCQNINISISEYETLLHKRSIYPSHTEHIYAIPHYMDEHIYESININGAYCHGNCLTSAEATSSGNSTVNDPSRPEDSQMPLEEEWFQWSEDSEEEDKEEVPKEIGKCQDNPADIEKKDRLYLIANELYTTEAEYVNRLAILYQVAIRVAELLPDGVGRQMFPDIDVMFRLHHGNMLPELRARLQNWNKSNKIGDIMRSLAPFLKLYTDYVQNFDKASGLIDTWLAKSSEFSKFIKDVQDNAGKCKLPIKSYMLEPVQRVPRYELLLKDYLKRLPENSEDRADTEKALELVAEVARHFEKTIIYYSRVNQLIKLQRQLDGPVNIVDSDRNLVKEGKILKVHATSGKVVERYAFLFNDLFLLCNDMKLKIPGAIQRFKVKQVMEVDGMQITDGDNLDVENTFYIKTKQKALELSTSNEEEKSKWIQTLSRTVGERTRERLRKTGGGSKRGKTAQENQTLGKQAPVWVHNSEVTMCMVCAGPFSALKKKKHHCRACGSVVCGKCSSRTAILEYSPTKPCKVCDECFLLINERCDNKRGTSTKSPKVRAKDGAMSGYMQLSTDAGRTWRKHWFLVHQDGVLFSFKANKDIKPMSSLALRGCELKMLKVTASQSRKETVIRLANENKTYYFKDDNDDKIPKWAQAINGSIQNATTPQKQTDGLQHGNKATETDI